ncbi:MAG TPA: S41 family peptidase, partial [Vicinamibacteria bacterium]
GRPRTFLVLDESDENHLRLHFNGAASDVLFSRVETMPDVCRQPTPSTPPSVFDVFTTTWAEHYPFFALRNADWPAIVARYRERVREDTSPEDLFAVLKEMIAPFEDAHTFIRAESLDQSFHGERRSPAWVEESDEDRAYGLVSGYLKRPLRSFCEGQLEHGMLEPDVGYLRLRSFSGYHKDGSFESGLAALEAALDQIFAGAGSWRGLVIDVRINGGGADPYGLAIASRLTDREYLAYSKQARNDPGDAARWTEEQPSDVKPTTRPGFRGPIVELIGIQSVSAAETFTQALLKRKPEVVRAGENTQGVFSDVLGRRLPNGWRFGLPNERFVTDGRAYDGPGIAPAVEVLSFTREGLASGRDAGIEKALELLKER